jgi:hypothetical protein
MKTVSPTPLADGEYRAMCKERNVLSALIQRSRLGVPERDDDHQGPRRVVLPRWNRSVALQRGICRIPLHDSPSLDRRLAS